MEIVRDADAAEFLVQAGALLYREEALNNLILGLAETAAGDTSPLCLRVVDEGVTVSAALRTPPRNLVLARATNEQLTELIDYLLALEEDIPGVVGPSATSTAFARVWSQATGRASRLAMGQWIYAATAIQSPQVEGQARPANESEIDLVAEWLVEFSAESLPPDEHLSFEQLRPTAEKFVRARSVHIWFVGAIPVSMASFGRGTRRAAAVRAVYTPPPLRRRGYASAVTAHLSQELLRSGKDFCVLYTDASNPTSNKIYQQIGYRPVGESAYYQF